jgi:hypothetical protein
VAKPSKPAPQDAKVEKKAAKPVDAKEKNSVEEPAATNAAADTE